MAALALIDIWKRFGATAALSGAAFELAAGEVHALVGANGAGKSTLSRIVSGHIQPDRGRMLLDGEEARHGGSRDAIRAGIAMVTQETSLAPDLTVLENIMLPRLGMPGRVRWPELRTQARQIIVRFGDEAGLALDRPVRDLSIGQRQLVEIAKALALDSRIIIFDEPTASLSLHESERLFAIMRALSADGHSLVFVSHRLEEIFAVTDRVTVLREGRTVAAGAPTASLSQGDLVRLMVGRELSDIYATTQAQQGSGTTVLAVTHLASLSRVRDVSFSVRAGEIVGLAGLVGAGRSETLETIFGLRQPISGEITLNGAPFHPHAPLDAIRAGIGLVPEDRRGQGIVPDFSVRENLLLAHLGQRAGMGLGYAARSDSVRRLLEPLDLPAHRLLDANMLTFSGGMQQKIILARWLVLQPKLLLLDEPTRGVDIGTRGSIYALLRRIAAEGVACVVVSSDFEEVLGIADRIVVLSDGVSVTDIPSHLLDIEKLAMFAAPRSSAQRTHTVLESLVQTHGGVAYWIAVERDRVFCFDRVGQDAAADPGFSGGAFPLIADTAIRTALSTGAAPSLSQDDGRSTLLAAIRGRRGHSLGLLGLTLARVPPSFDPRAASATIEDALSPTAEAA